MSFPITLIQFVICVLKCVNEIIRKNRYKHADEASSASSASTSTDPATGSTPSASTEPQASSDMSGASGSSTPSSDSTSPSQTNTPNSSGAYSYKFVGTSNTLNVGAFVMLVVSLFF
ncbi:1085_t:CDS:2 [Ambispora gerdemannii]|uniref:1085_t:CDS:1 n=1 Tax=Ambispora gerdemannii TaxID=144530 RepID=A0A9N9BRB9_9GLOM|nr:1085_t:CDS:2 [Ambispora gerdemannii]